MNSQLILQKIREFGEDSKTKKYYEVSKKDKSLLEPSIDDTQRTITYEPASEPYDALQTQILQGQDPA